MLAAEINIRQQNYATAAEQYKSAAAQNNAQAQFHLANMYFLGKGVAKNETAAMHYLNAAAQQGLPAAMFNLGVKLREANENRSTSLIRLSASQGYAPATKYLENLSTQTPQKSLSNGAIATNWFSSVQRGDITTLTQLYKQKNNIDLTDESGRTGLYIAIDNNNKATFNWLLQYGASSDHTDKFGETPIHLAIAREQVAMLETLLIKSRQKSIRLKNGDNLLHYAIRRHKFTLLPLLLNSTSLEPSENTIAINQLNMEQMAPLDLCGNTSAENCVNLLASKGGRHGNATAVLKENYLVNLQLAQLEKPVRSDTLVPVILAANTELLEAVLKENRQLITQPLKNGGYLLEVAVTSNKIDTLNGLLSVDYAIPQEQLSGALLQAVNQNKLSFAKRLLEVGANPLDQDTHKASALNAAIKQQHLEMARLLLNWTKAHKTLDGKADYSNSLLLASKSNFTALMPDLIDLKVKDSYDELGRSALWFSSFNCSGTIVDALLKKGFDANRVDKDGRTPLFIAVQKGCVAATDLLLEVTSPNTQSLAGSTPLMAAALNGSNQLVGKLLAHDADPNLRDNQGNSALIKAVESDSIDVIAMLINAGANRNRKNKLGLSAVDIADRLQNEAHRYFQKR